MRILTVIGLVYSLGGALLFVRAVTTVTKKYLANLSATLPGGNPHLFETGLLQRTDAYCGLALISVGFFLQILGEANINPPILCTSIVGAVALVLYVVLYELLRRRIRTKGMAEYKKYMKGE